MVEGTLIEIAKQGIVGVIAVLFVLFYRKERKKVDQIVKDQIEMAKSFNRQIADLNEKRAEEIRIMAEALISTADASHDVADSMEKLRDFVIAQRLRGYDNEKMAN
jgi:hypothetical protein